MIKLPSGGRERKNRVLQTISLMIGMQRTEELDVDGGTVTGIFIPATLTGANVTIEAAAAPAGPYAVAVYPTGANITLAPTVPEYWALNTTLLGVRFLRLHSDVVQAVANADLVFIVEEV